ncbi:N-acetyltransferase [Siminovitchia terrae]|uniref:GNAT family N-acetyltransferase n=1 Tax=Siminovitchia terrae TaxID=1914933 RepID=UPI001B08DD1B|nr:GNAT family N-acetyltransferase [Siminovitchia terrae]GIN89795.1 N-acetyltransferase [Siminovitchia terrae]
MKYLIRKMLPDDISQVQYVARTSWNNTYEGIIPLKIQDCFLDMAYSDEMLRKRLERSNIFISEMDYTITGFADFSDVKKNGEAELAAIYIDPAYQGKGLGTALLETGIKNLKDIRKLFVNVEKKNRSGVAFYTAKGFTACSEFEDDFDGHILKTIRMVLLV